MYRILLCLLVGFSVGGVSGALGIGGGVLLVPALMWLFGFDYPRAAGTSLAILVPPVGLLAAWRSYEEGRVDVQAAVWIALAFAVGAYGGAAAVRYLPTEVLRLAFGSLMIYIAVRFIFAGSSEATSAAAGLFGVAVAWLLFLFFRALGRRQLPPPDLGEWVRARHALDRGESDYTI